MIDTRLLSKDIGLEEDGASHGFRRTATDTVALPWCADSWCEFVRDIGLAARSILNHPTNTDERWEGDRVGRRAFE